MKSPIFPVIMAAMLFGAATPLLKLLLTTIDPLTLTALLYTGAAAGVACLFGRGMSSPTGWNGFGFRGYVYLAGSIISGGLLAPLIQFISLSITPAATASLLLNFEIVTTTCIGYAVFHESVSKKLVLAIVLILLGSIVLSVNSGFIVGFSTGAFGILISCLFWGIDNNLMGKIGQKSPYRIIIIKGFATGSILFLLVFLFHSSIPGTTYIILALISGFLTFGLGLIFLVRSLNTLGAVKTGAYLALAPCIGIIISLVIFREIPGIQFFLSLPLIMAGLILLLYERSATRLLRNEKIFKSESGHPTP